MEELKAASTESTAKSAQLEQELKQLREEKAETDEYLSEFEAASLAENQFLKLSLLIPDIIVMLSGFLSLSPCRTTKSSVPSTLVECFKLPS